MPTGDNYLHERQLDPTRKEVFSQFSMSLFDTSSLGSVSVLDVDPALC